jgi:shikimate dehydrogenase
MTRPSRLVLLGHPVAQSFSPRIHNAALRAANIPLEYTLIDVTAARLAAVLHELRSAGAAGNLTIPHKQAAFGLCDHVTGVADRAGAVNTFWVQDGELIGDNTDIAGFEFAVRELLDTARIEQPKRVAILGAGGAAAAVATAVSEWQGTEIVVWSRDGSRAATLAQRFDSARAEPELLAAVRGADLVVNATPLGMVDDSLPVPIEALARKCLVFDLVCRTGETAWVRAARDAGFHACDGMPMLVEQAARSFRRWLGVEPNREVMWAALT